MNGQNSGKKSKNYLGYLDVCKKNKTVPWDTGRCASAGLSCWKGEPRSHTVFLKHDAEHRNL